MSFDHIRSWFELEEINEQQERMITVYENEIQKLEQENAELKEQLIALKQKLEDTFNQEGGDAISTEVR
jgi:DNA-directed RNA polymerase delta subunit